MGGVTPAEQPTSSGWLVRMDDVRFSYPNGVEALGGVNFEIKEGEILSLVGPSGCGKSTLISVLAELRRPSGTVTWNRERLQTLGSDRRKINVVFQKDTVMPWLTVEKNVAFGLKYLKLAEGAKAERITSLLAMAGLSEFRHAHPSELSGGMLRRVALLAGVATFPKLLVLDEPFSALDEPTRIGIHDDLFKLVRELGISVLLITHDLGEAVSLSDRVGVVTRRPARMAHLEDIPLGQERQMAHIRSEPQFQRSYRSLWERLWEQIEGA